MTLVQEADLQRFVFPDADWSFYDDVLRRVEGRRAFVTFYKGKLEVVTTSFLHEQMAFLLHRLLMMLAEVQAVPIKSAGRTTLHDLTLDEGVEPDTSFYLHANADRMTG